MTAVDELETGWLPSTPVDDTLLRAFLRNQAALNALVADAGHGHVHDDDLVSVADAGSPVAYQNQAVLHRPLRTVDDPALDVAETHLCSGRSATLLSAWPTPDLRSRGWHLVGHPAFVVRGPVAATQAPHPRHPGLEIHVADCADDLAVAEDLMVRGYPVPEAIGAPRGSAFPADLLETPVLVRVCSIDGVPVAVAASLPMHGVVNLCLAATLPEARHRGAWTALVDDRCGDVPHLPAAAFTSDDSRPGFVRAGFLPVVRFTLWLRP
ncbi:MAG TPA: hypothetical protein VFL59_00335 [Candidatus Nanopelagicales bacterium]|nr:hypothetical protein [Candidatus Nanopelagicales bacterium]